MSAVVTLLFVSLVLAAGGASVAAAGKADPNKAPDQSAASYVGAQQCVACHQQQHDLWQGSHHDLAMQPANDKTVLGDFDNASFDYYGTVSTFYKQGNRLLVKTDGPDGSLTDYPIAYTFGVYPLQQYLIRFPRGRYQALNIAWDTRSKKDGGQRWFHLYPDEHIKHDDELHWTGINQNWNFMCADCHSTHLQKNYDLASRQYSSSWSDIDVSCEACHGPASRHIAWAKNKDADSSDKGLSVAYHERDKISWVIDPVTGNAKRSRSKQTSTEIEACAQCHSRRATMYPDAKPEQPLLQNFRPALLTDPLYYADGQINGEVYVYGSFLQSKMYRAGVTCSDCHQPHSLKLRAEGNDLCGQCHLATKYDVVNHHAHKPGTEGARCVNCHMPTKNYMVVDARRDHSFRIPRPDLSVTLGVPNACTQCHSDKTAEWAATVLEKKNGKPVNRHFAQAIYAGRHGLPDAERMLAELVLDDTQPAIVRATAVSLLPRYLSQQSAQVLQMDAHDEQPLLGLGLAGALEAIPAQYRHVFAVPLLYDDMRTTRALAANSLVGNDSLKNLPADARTKFSQALDEYIDSELFNADRPESLVNLASVYAQQGQPRQAEQFYRKAIALAPYYTPAYINLADFYRNAGNDAAGDKVLQSALPRVRDKAVVHHALGLLRVRQKKLAEAVEYLRLAAESPTATARYVYVYAIALHSSGKAQQAVDVLQQAQQNYPGNTDILSALISINNELGNHAQARHYESLLRGEH